MLDSPPSSPAREPAGMLHRARGMERVLFMLRERHHELDQAIAGLSEELGRIRLQLAMSQLTGQRPETPDSDAKVNGKARA